MTAVRSAAGLWRTLADRSLSVVMLGLYVASHVGAAVSGWFEFASQQAAHRQPAVLFGDHGYVWTLLEQTFQNWQSEFLAVSVLVVASSVLIHRGSKVSRDSQDEFRRRAQAIDRRVSSLPAPRAR